MKRFAIVQHTYSEFLGLFESQLEKRDIGFDYFRPFTGQDLPGTAIHFDALFCLGGGSAMDEALAPWLQQEQRLLNLFLQAQRPVVGLGDGALLLAQVAGGEVIQSTEQTAYWTTAHATEYGRDDPVAQAVDGQRVLVMYNGAVSLPEGVNPLVVDETGNWLAIHPTPTSYGLLFRPELKPGMIEDIIMEEGRETPDNIGEILQQAREEWVATQETTDRILVALVQELDLMQERRKAPVFMMTVEDK